MLGYEGENVISEAVNFRKLLKINKMRDHIRSFFNGTMPASKMYVNGLETNGKIVDARKMM